MESEKLLRCHNEVPINEWPKQAANRPGPEAELVQDSLSTTASPLQDITRSKCHPRDPRSGAGFLRLTSLPMDKTTRGQNVRGPHHVVTQDRARITTMGLIFTIEYYVLFDYF